MSSLKKLTIIFLLFFWCVSFITGQENIKYGDLQVRIDQIISADFPNLEIYASVTDKEGKPVLSLIPGNFKLFVDGQAVESKLNLSGFQYSDEGIAYSVLLSANGMMEGGPINQQQKAVIALLESLREQDTVSLYTFGEEIKPQFEFEKNNEKLLEKIAKTDLLGFNPHLYDGLVFAARRFSETELKRKVLIVMSDGREVESKYNKDQLYKIVDELNIPVYGIGIRMMGGQNLYRLHQLAFHTGGGYRVARGLTDIPRTMKLLNDQIRLGYVLKFRVTSLRGDDQYHQLQLKVNNEGQEGDFSKNFLAVKVPIPLWVKIAVLVVILVLIIIIIIMLLVFRKSERKKMGITNRKCPDCKRRMKDDWDECLFCKYLPSKKAKKKKKDK